MDCVYHLQEFRLRTEPIQSDFRPRHHSQTPASSESRPLSPKRALARGDDPEEVIRRIADYRAADKHNPEYYARHTVEKAQLEVQSSTVARQAEPSRREAT